MAKYELYDSVLVRKDKGLHRGTIVWVHDKEGLPQAYEVEFEEEGCSGGPVETILESQIAIGGGVNLQIRRTLLEFVDRCNARFPRIAEIYDLYRHCEFAGMDEYGVNFIGHEYWSRGGHEKHQHTVIWDYFLCSDEQFENLLLVVAETEDLKKQEAKAKAQLQLEEKQKLEEEQERQEYERLKEKYG